MDYILIIISAIFVNNVVLAKFLGIPKVVYPQKLFGVYPTRNLVPDHPITGGLDDVFFCPQSRHAGIDEVEPLGFDEVGVDEALHLGRHAEVYPDLMEACAGHGFLPWTRVARASR